MSWWKYAKPGDKVVCVFEPLKVKDHAIYQKVKVGEVYEIAHVGFDPWFDNSDGVFFILVGSPYDQRGACMFRPVQTKSTETGMAVLRKLLTSKKAQVKT
jgi:hypothetical protein